MLGWLEMAACRGQPVRHFFASGGASTAAVRLCDGCPVRGECLEECLAQERLTHGRHIFGYRAGMTAKARVRLLNEKGLWLWRCHACGVTGRRDPHGKPHRLCDACKSRSDVDMKRRQRADGRSASGWLRYGIEDEASFKQPAAG